MYSSAADSLDRQVNEQTEELKNLQDDAEATTQKMEQMPGGHLFPRPQPPISSVYICCVSHHLCASSAASVPVCPPARQPACLYTFDVSIHHE